MASEIVEELVEKIAALSLLEASELKTALEDKLGVEAASGGGGMMMMPGMMGGAAAPAADAEPAEEQTEFDVVLESIGDKKINVIKALRAITSLGLKEAKEQVESAPVTVMEQVGKEAAQDAIAKLEEAGAKAVMK